MTGKLAVLEGIDRAGKTSVFSALPTLLSDCKVGTTFCSEKTSPLGTLLSNDALSRMSPLLKTYLFAADRAWIYETQCLPALQAGGLVIWDRYVASALIYRRAEQRLRPADVDYELVEAVNRPFLRPDLTILLDIPPEVSIARSIADAETPVYGLEFLRIAREEYLSTNPFIIDAARSVEEIAMDVASAVRTSFRGFFP